jgi:hypothetical protein
MSAPRKILLPAALMLALIMASAVPATGQGLWTYQHYDESNVTISIVNLTTQRLVVTSPAASSTFYIYCNIMFKSDYVVCLEAQSRAFQRTSSLEVPSTTSGVPACPGLLCIDPSRTATWGSGDVIHNGDWAWDGRFSVEYDNPASPWNLWTVIVNASLQSVPNRGDHPVTDPNLGKGSWWYLYPLNRFSNGCELWPGADAYSPEGVYVTPILPGPMDSDTAKQSQYATRKFSVMTMWGNDCGGLLAGSLTASLFAGANNHLVLVLREHLPGDNYIGWKLDYVDQPNDSVPLPPGCNGCWWSNL